MFSRDEELPPEDGYYAVSLSALRTKTVVELALYSNPDYGRKRLVAEVSFPSGNVVYIVTAALRPKVLEANVVFSHIHDALAYYNNI